MASRGAAVAAAATLCGLATGVSCSGGSGRAEPADAATDRAIADAGGALDRSEMIPESGFPEASAPDAGCGDGAICPSAVPQVLASHQPTPAGVALDDAYVYWVDLGTYLASDGGSDAGSDAPSAAEPDGGSDAGSDAPSAAEPDGGADAGPVPGPYVGARVERCAKAGCGDSPQLLAAGTWNGMSKIAVQGSTVYWLTTSEVLACPVDGCPGSPSVIWSGAGALSDLAVDSTGVYFADPQTASVLMCPLSGCAGAATALYPDPLDAQVPDYGAALAIALDAGNVYFTTSAGFVLSCSESDSVATLRVVAENQDQPLQVAVDGSNVYFTDFRGGALGRVLSCPKSGCNDSPTVLVDGLSWPTGLATDGTDVYFTELGDEGDSGAGGVGRVARCATGGCGDRATAVAGFVNEPLGIAVDSDHDVYWADFGSAISTTGTDVGRVMVSGP